jgi:hypothetical protein
MAIRFHLDENVDHRIATALRSRGIDVTTTTDANLIGESDESQLAFAHRANRVIFSHDADILRLHAAGVAHSGIVFASDQSRTIGEIVAGLVLIHDCCEPEEMVGQVEFL